MTDQANYEMLKQLDNNRIGRANFVSNGMLYAACLRERDKNTIIRALTSTISYTFGELAEAEEKMAREVWRMDIKQNNMAKATEASVIGKYRLDIASHEKKIKDLDEKISDLHDKLETYFFKLAERRQSKHVLKRAEVTEPEPV